MLFNPRRRLDPHVIDTIDSAMSELSAIKGRMLGPKNIDTRGHNYLQLGCGDDHLPGFLNTDFFTNRKADAGLDVRFRLPFQHNTWRGIYAHHVVEHISYEDAKKLFSEVRRVLKPGGVFRMVVPDLEVFLRSYCAGDRQAIMSLLPDHHMRELTQVQTPLEMIDYIFRDNKWNRHLSAWDFETAKHRLMEAGFSTVTQQTVNVSSDPKLIGHDKPDWAPHSLYVDATKTNLAG